MAKVKLGKFEVDEEELERQHKEAVKRGREVLAALPKAESAKYDKDSKRLIVNMENGTTLLVPVHLIQGLQTDDDEALNDFDLMQKGSQIHWHTLDVQFYVKSLLNGVFGTPKWMENLKKSSPGSDESKSETKKNASRENGKKGGRPRRNVA